MSTQSEYDLLWAIPTNIRYSLVLRILSVSDSESYEHYPTTLFHPSEAYAGACTTKTTIYCANIAAGIMIAQFTKYLRHLPIMAVILIRLAGTTSK